MCTVKASTHYVICRGDVRLNVIYDKFLLRSQRTYNAATVDKLVNTKQMGFASTLPQRQSSVHHTTLKIEVVLSQAA